MATAHRKFILGPYFTTSAPMCQSIEGVEATGQVMEFATDEGHFTVPIFRKSKTMGAHPIISDYCFNEECELTVNVLFHAFFAVQTPVGRFIPFDRLIAGIFDDYFPAEGLLSFLEKVSEHFPHSSFSAKLPSFELLKPELTGLGFAVCDLSSYGDGVRVELCWVPEVSRREGNLLQYFFSGSFTFRPKHDGTLGNGTCGECWEKSLPLHLLEELKAQGMRHPIDCLSEPGIAKCLSVFEWQPKHRISKAELAQKRLALVGRNPDLWSDVKALTRLLKLKGLYSISTSESQIAKTVNAMIARLKGL